jgi:two-component system CAI-1 autoinducer sensor kinase/phosphatase CqsS
MKEDLHRAPYSPTPPRFLLEGWSQRVRHWTSNEVLQPLVEPVLHPSRWRIRAIGASTLLGHPVFFLVWAMWLPQPYESLTLRLLMAALGLSVLVIPGVDATPPTRTAAVFCSIVFWITLPLFFSWMYFCNAGNPVWLASMGAMLLIYYNLTDWRLASLGAASGMAVAWLLFEAFGPPTPLMTMEHVWSNIVILAFCWYTGIVLGLSSSNLRREQLKYTLDTMAIMAHELRTPLATMHLIGEAVRNESPQEGSESGENSEKLQQLGQRLNHLVRNMNHQIDMQITNARLMRLPVHAERVGAAELVRTAIADYPYRSSRERQAVVVRVYSDFQFLGSRQMFAQVIDNLTKNALRSLAAASSSPQPGDLVIEVGAHGPRGRIAFTDNGIGMEPDLRKRIFQPFFSTDRGTGHGLGLAFCQRVVQAAHGSIRVKSAPHQGAVFTIELPVA